MVIPLSVCAKVHRRLICTLICVFGIWVNHERAESNLASEPRRCYQENRNNNHVAGARGRWFTRIAYGKWIIIPRRPRAARKHQQHTQPNAHINMILCDYFSSFYISILSCFAKFLVLLALSSKEHLCIFCIRTRREGKYCWGSKYTSCFCRLCRWIWLRWCKY
jgi:hypothetical protein